MRQAQPLTWSRRRKRPCPDPSCYARCSTSATSRRIRRRNRSVDGRVVNFGRYIGPEETAMHTTRFKRMALTSLFAAGWVAFFSATITYAQPLYASPPPPQPPPTFNPSTPYTVPQSPQTPVSPGLPNALPRSESVSPSVGSLPRAVARSHRRPVTVTGTSHVIEAEPRMACPQCEWGVCGAFEIANRCNAEWSPRSHRCGCIVR